MFEALAGKLEGVFSRLRGRGKLTPENIHEAMRQVRRALLEADVNYKVARQFVRSVEERAVGQEVLRSVTPGEQVVKIVYDALVELLGGEAVSLAESNEIPTRILFVGLQGSGKTTCVAKVATRLKARGRVCLLVPCDVHRPAAADQLRTLAEAAGVRFFEPGGLDDPAAIARRAWEHARSIGADYCLVDTAGRLQIDEEMMQEAERIKEALEPHQTLLVVDGLTGQEAVSVSHSFHERLGIDAVVLTKMEGDARGGAALSVRAATGVPILFAGTGERLADLETFHPAGMASRILGMGDVVALVEKAQQAVDLEEAERLRRNLERNRLTLEDFLTQLRNMKKMGPVEELVKLIPGLGARLAGQIGVDDAALRRTEAIILSMTPEERRRPEIIDGSRRRRIARGSGTSVQEVNRLLREFAQMRRLFGKAKGKRRRLALF